MNNLLSLIRQAGALKTLPRAGWVRSGLPDPESVADHSYRTALLALLLGDELGVDTTRVIQLLLVHDLPESDPEVGDITPYCGVPPDEKRRREQHAMERLCAGVPGGEHLLALWLEYAEARTPESAIAHQLDALEMAFQAREYEQQTKTDLSEFLQSARAKIHHPALVRLLESNTR
jgi:5'-deoxynucleotidase YfbR-like HD superfamily hydrolase